MENIQVTCFDKDATAFATFQSHNRKVVANQKGCFLSYIKSRNEPYTRQNIKLFHAFTNEVLYDKTLATNPPALETDEDSNLYLVYPDFESGHSTFVVFRHEDDYRDPKTFAIPHTSGGKFAMARDKKRNLFYYVPNNGDMNIIDAKGNLVTKKKIVYHGKTSSFEYPHLSMDESSTLHLAWTTDLHHTYHYPSIHYMRTKDGGTSWQRMDNTDITMPVASDDEAGGTIITDDNEHGKNKFLAAFCVYGNKAHFMYRANPHPDFKIAKDDFHNGIQRYKRYDLATGKRDIDRSESAIGGEKIKLAFFDGFFCADHRAGKNALYFVAKQGTRLGCIVSHDRGATWIDYAQSENLAEDTYHIYATGGCANVSEDGFIYGSFTKRCGDYMDPFVKSEAYVIKIKAKG